MSYFLRNTQMYDTLMQMGRWFGYQDGYKDLCRLFLPPEAHDWYGFIAEATEELRSEIRRMELHGLTPMDFGLAVRSHPGSLVVTARDKMRNTEQVVREIGLAGCLVETSVLIESDRVRGRNIEAVRDMVKVLRTHAVAESVDPSQQYSSRLFRKVRSEHVLDFISSFATHPGQLELQAAPLSNYIRERRLEEWDVVIVSNTRARPEADELEVIEGLTVGLQERVVERRNTTRFGNALLVSGTKRRVGSRGVERIGLTDEQLAAAYAEHGDAKNIPDRLFRQRRSRPLLMVHLLKAKLKAKDGEESLGTYAAYGISFPGLATGEKDRMVMYTANLIAYRELYGRASDEEDDDDSSD